MIALHVVRSKSLKELHEYSETMQGILDCSQLTCSNYKKVLKRHQIV